jgi:peptidoglycan hydrolase-like protein with peptidoglycan-binding domain
MPTVDKKTGKTVYTGGEALPAVGSQAYKEAQKGTPAVKTTPAPVTKTTTTLLKTGSSGSNVSSIQSALGITADGKFGPQTDAAVRAFQKQNGLAVDGIVGPQTEAALLKKTTGGTPPPPTTEPTDTTQPDPKNPTLPKDQQLTPVVQQPNAADPNATAPIDPTTGLPIPNAAAPAAATVSSYSGPSIMDYLSSIGQPSDFASRAALAGANGIPNYIGSPAQNTQLLSTLRQTNPGGSVLGATSAAQAGLNTGGGATADPNDPAAAPVKSEFQQGIDAVLKEFGITPPAAAQSPQSSFSDTYQQVYENLGLQDIKDQYNDFTKQYGDLMDKKNEKISEINNDPWLTEGVRQLRLKKLDTDYELRESNILDKIKLTETMYDNGRQDAQYVTSGIMTQFNKTKDLNENIMMKAIDIAESRSEAENKPLERSKNYRRQPDRNVSRCRNQYDRFT